MRRDSDRKCKAMKRAIETESKTVACRASNRCVLLIRDLLRLTLKLLHVELITGYVLLIRDFLIETESGTVAHRASSRLCTANKRLLETESETVAQQVLNC